jgi:hypothetical protein
MRIDAEQKIVTMSLDEFRKWDISKYFSDGWKLMYVSGSERRGYPGSLDRYFEMTVTIQKENGNGV